MDGNNLNSMGKKSLNDLLVQIRALSDKSEHATKTRRRELATGEGLAAFLAGSCGLRKFKNFSGDHLRAYAQARKTQGITDATLMSELSAIRYIYSLSGGKNRLPDNEHLGIQLSRVGSRKDRAWSEEEYGQFLAMCREQGRNDYAAVLTLAWELGLRIHEIFRLDRAAAEAAFRCGKLEVKGKGGLVRQVPLTPESRSALEERCEVTSRGGKLFLDQHDLRTDLAIKRFQNFIDRNRSRVQTSDRGVSLTCHGLRHSFARRTYRTFLDMGISEKNALRQTSLLMGHKRDEITLHYLSE